MKRYCRRLMTPWMLAGPGCSAILLLTLTFGIAPLAALGSEPLERGSVHRADGVGALLLSDIHLDPFQDPAKVRQLAEAPIEAWTRILNATPSADRVSAFARVRDKCGKEVFDTSPALLAATLNAVRAQRQQVTFAVLTGDLIAHDFFCRFNATLPGHSHEEARVFLTKTIEYVIGSLSRAVGAKPLYVALGNNDSDCGDYRLDQSYQLFRDLLPTVAHAARVPASTLSAQGFESSGRFVVSLPSPLRATRIIVMDDLPFSSRFESCIGAKSSILANDNLLWLKEQLRLARLRKENVWFEAHIPTGIDPRPTLFGSDVCTSRKPTMFLSSDALGRTLADFADVVTLSLFAHTHMDEMRLLESDTADAMQHLAGVPVKMIPSISPVAGNRPSFLVAKIDASTAVMSDYVQYVAPSTGDVETAWSPTYSFREAYQEPSFSAPALEDLFTRFGAAASQSRDPASRYIERYSSGAPKYGIAPVWNSYRCVLRSTTADQFLNCACPATEPSRERK